MELSTILLQIDPSGINNIYAFLAVIVITVGNILIIIYNKNKDKKQTEKIIETFEKQNDNIIKKMEELKQNKNILDSQSSMDIINSLLTKSMLEIINGVEDMINDSISEQKSLLIPVKSLIMEKIKILVDKQIKDDIIVLGRIYNNNIKLSHYISELNINELIEEITYVINCSTNKKDSTDIINYITNRFSQFIQSIELQLSK